MNKTAKHLAILPDFREEGWPSMDLCAEQLLSHCKSQPHWEAQETLPEYRNRFRFLGSRGVNLDRAWNRYVSYPRFAKTLANSYDFFHIVDHSYAHLVHSLPAERTGVYCHDVDAFRCILEPEKEPRGKVFRILMNKVLTGLKKARYVFVNSQQTAEQLRQFKVVDPAKIVMTPLGISAEFQPSEVPPEPLSLLHVGSCIPRKRIDVLLKVLAKLRESFPTIKLVKVGGEWSAEQQAILEQHKLETCIEHRHNLSRSELASAYQQAAVVLVPSSAEGFGLPVIEALACGSVVVASDIPPLREGGGAAAIYAPVGDVEAWVAIIKQLIAGEMPVPERQLRLQEVQRFSWAKHAETILNTYSA
jgi:glycosyltransferase involved in cell wall biosynthesis